MKPILRAGWLGAAIAGIVPAFAACGGGASGVVPGVQPAVRPAVASHLVLDAAHTKRGKAQIVIRIPWQKKQPRSRMRPRYISPSTQSMTVAIVGQPAQTVNLTASSPACSASKATHDLTCSLTAFSPVGKQTLTITLYDELNGAGHELSTASTTVNITAGAVTTVPVTLNGVVARVMVLLGLPGNSTLSVPRGTPTSIPVSVNAYDADNNLIVAPGDYTAPIQLSNSDTSGATKLSTSSAAAPGAKITLRYTGAAFSTVTITPSILSGFPQPAGAATLTLGSTRGITEYAVPTIDSYPFGIATGPGGAWWFTEYCSDKIGRITSGKPITEYPIPNGSSPENIVAGSDGALWFTEPRTSSVGRMTTKGIVTEHVLPVDVERGLFQYPYGITAGPDGALWFTAQIGDRDVPLVGAIGRITTSGSIKEFTISASGSDPEFIVTGPDKALWFTDSGTKAIGRITTDGKIAEYPVPIENPSYPSTPTGITLGPDGALWFTNYYQNDIGRITTNKTITQYAIPLNNPVPQYGVDGSGGITAGPDGALWFAEQNAGTIGRITTGGVVTQYPIPTSSSAPTTIAAGAHALWFTEQRTNKIGHIPVSIVNSTHQ